MREGLRAVRRALLEADCSVKAVDVFIGRVEKAALGRDVLKSLNPSQQIVQVVYEELCNLMGPVDPSIKLVPNRPTVIMMCGLQGSGKTTTCGKLAKLLTAEGQRPMLVAADLQRPAAVEQLVVLGEQLNVPVYREENSTPVKVCNNAIEAARAKNCNVIILDTAGRLAIDQPLMDELKRIDQRVEPDYAWLVCDAMTGQDAVISAKAFNDALELDAVILSKLDGDARGGAALSIKEITGVPIKFAGMGEKLDALEPFRPEGMASRILGMGDVLSLVNRAQQAVDQEEAQRQQEKMAKGKFDLSDFRKQLGSLGAMGSVRDLMKMLPGGLSEMLPEDEDPEESIRVFCGIIDSMTAKERADPSVLNPSRRRRIADGAGVAQEDVSRLVKQFESMKPVMQKFAGMSMTGRIGQLMNMAKGGMSGLVGGMFAKQKERSARNPMTNKQRAEARKQERKRKKDSRKRGR
jgi:signal recognition particle subunit SRP54